MTIAQILNAKGHGVVCVDKRLPVRLAIRQMADFGIGALLVLEKGKICGIFTERDFVRAMARQGEVVLDSPVESHMTRDIIIIDSSYSVETAMDLITNRRIRHLPVVDSGLLTGIVSIGDLLKRKIEQTERESSALRDYITSG